MKKGNRASIFQIILLARIVKSQRITIKNISYMYKKKPYSRIVDVIDKLVKMDLITYERENDLVFYKPTEEGIKSIQLVNDAIKSEC